MGASTQDRDRARHEAADAGAAGTEAERPAAGASSIASDASGGAGASDPAEPLTEELLARLLASSSPEAYLAGNETFDQPLADYLAGLLREKGLMRSEVLRDCGLNSTYGYQIFQGARKPGRDHAIMLALGLRCTLRETQRLLRYAGVSELWVKLRRDAIIIFCIEHGYDRARTDDELYRMGEQTLLPAEG